MIMRAAGSPSPGAFPAPFQLRRSFTLTSLVAFIVLAAALYLLERAEQQFFASVQAEQKAFFVQVQSQLLREQRDGVRNNLVMVHDVSHQTLTKVFANALWDSQFGPLVARASAISIEPCRAAGGGSVAVLAQAQAQAREACFARVGARVMALPGFAQADASARALMRGTVAFKVKVYDMRGLTVYSSEPGQIGEDKSGNLGWQSAARGTPASELVHRNRFSAFEGEVENRDLIQSYVPVTAPGGGIGGVFEIYSDVTSLLQQIEHESTRIFDATARNQSLVEEASDRNQRTVAANATKLLLIVAALLVLTYGALLFFVRNGQRIIDEQARAREQAALREQQWHQDKMATMAAMAANISHEVGNPLAIISGVAQDIAEWRDAGDLNPDSARLIVEQTARIANMTRRITDFATAGRETSEALDLNQLIAAVCDFLAFDKRFRGTPIELQLAAGLPAGQAVPDHLTEVLMGLLQLLEEACEQSGVAGQRIVVTTEATAHGLTARFASGAGCRLPLADPRLESARLRMQSMGGRLELPPGCLEVHIGLVAPADGAAAVAP